MPETTASLADLLKLSAERFAPHVAVARARAAGGGGLTYGKLRDAAQKGAKRLRAAGCARGDRVVLLAAPQPEWVAALFAILEAGCAAVPVPVAADPAQAWKAAEFAEARAAVVEGPLRLDPVRTLPFSELFAGEPGEAPGPRPKREDTALLVFTSGSTDRPRCVELTHGNVLADLEGLLRLRRAATGNSFLSMLPPSHLFELVPGTFAPLACGARVVYPGAVLPNRIVAALREESITHALAVPALLDALYREVRGAIHAQGLVGEAPEGSGVAFSAQWFRTASAERRAAVHDAVRATIGPSLRSLIVGGAALAPEWADVLAAVGVRLEVGYGLTETSPIVAMGAAEECPRGSVGRALPGVTVKVGEGGEILVSGPTVMRGYFRDPDATNAAIEDGWLRTGDVGRIDAQGFLFVEGRIKEAMVSASGETVYPEEMEPFYASPLFAEHVVAPRRGPDGNDVPTLYAWPRDPATTDEDLRRECARLRAAAPSRLRVADVVRCQEPPPRTASGKVQRRALGDAAAPGRRGVDTDAALRALLANVLKRDTAALGPDDDLVEKLTLDSLESLRVLAHVEKRFGVRFDDSRLGELRTLRKLAEAVEEGP